MENIGRLVNALEDQHKQRRFDIARPSPDGGDAAKTTTDPRHNTLDLGEPFRVSETVGGANSPSNLQSSTK